MDEDRGVHHRRVARMEVLVSEDLILSQIDDTRSLSIELLG